MSLDVVREIPLDHWAPLTRDGGDTGHEAAIESGKVLFFPRLNLPFSAVEECFLSEQWSDGKTKNLSYRGMDLPLKGAQGAPQEIERLKGLMARFADNAEQLVQAIFPRYRRHLKRGFTSYRTARAESRVTSWRKDDTRLHVDAFPAHPTGGVRLLRVFCNVNPAGQPRVWRVGEPFAEHAAHFFPRTTQPIPGYAWLLEMLGITKSRRTDYDHYMGQLHDLCKADPDYQRGSPQLTFAFPAGSTWVVFSDQVPHAVMAGQFMLEQTFFLAPEHLVNLATGPLHILESLAGLPLLKRTSRPPTPSDHHV